jgi:serine/threonine protein kinase
VHRDIKLSNCLYSQQQNAYVLADYGLSHTVFSNYRHDCPLLFFGGTPGYMSPALEKRVSLVNLYHNDVFALKKTLIGQKIEIPNTNNIKQIEAKIDHIEILGIKLGETTFNMTIIEELLRNITLSDPAIS